jgi:hypothetical protein
LADTQTRDLAHRWGVAAAIAALALSVLVGGQVGWPTPAYVLVEAPAIPTDGTIASTQRAEAVGQPLRMGAFYRQVEGRRMVAPAFTNVTLDPQRLPRMGEPDAPHLLVLVFDYTCEHCRAMHDLLRLAQRRYGRQMAVLMVPSPINSRCNPFVQPGIDREGACEYARLGLALWRVSSEAFGQFEDWVLESEGAPPIDLALERAVELVGRTPLENALSDPAIEQQVKANIEFSRPLMDAFRTLPVVLMEHKFLAGVPASPNELYLILERRLGVHPLPGHLPIANEFVGGPTE